MNYLTDDDIITTPLVLHMKTGNNITADYNISQTERCLRRRKLKRHIPFKETGKRTIGSETIIYKNNNLN